MTKGGDFYVTDNFLLSPKIVLFGGGGGVTQKS